MVGIDFAKEFNAILKRYVDSVCANVRLDRIDNIDMASGKASVSAVSVDEYLVSETLGDVIDKLVVLHVRVWNLEDQLVLTDSDEEAGKIAKKIMHEVRTKRPRLIVAINKMMEQVLVNNNLDVLKDEDTKVYKGED